MRIFLGLTAALAATSLLLALSAGGALASNVHCGDTITHDVTLDADLVGCPGAALSVQGQGSNITINLNGHTVEGALTEAGGSQYAITLLAQDMPGSLTVENGVVYGGIVVGHATGLIKDMVLRGASGRFKDGVAFGKGSRGAVTNTLIEDTSLGFDASHTAGEIDITNSMFRRNGAAVHSGQGGFPVLTNSVIIDNGGAISLSDAATRLDGNLIARNAGYGIAANRSGIEAKDNQITLNAGGITLGESDFTLTGNDFSLNRGYGIVVDGSGEIVGNTADRNALDGIRTSRATSATISGNHTWFNGKLGIEALVPMPGTGNWAKHNGDPSQCLNVTCSTTGKPKK